MDEQIQESFLGRGWSFPPAFSATNHNLEMVSEVEDIQQSLYLLISTIPGERIMNPAYGCDLHKFVFRPISSSTQSEIIATISRAILLFEPRIKLANITVNVVSIDPGILHIVVDYLIIKTNSRSNMVYPFYLQQGTNLV